LLLLVEDILQMIKIEHENNRKDIKELNTSQTFNLGECITSIKDMVKGYASQFSVKLKVFTDERIKDMIVKSNLSRMNKILANLLTNAVKASNKFGTVELTCNYMGQQEDGMTRVKLIVKDFGAGIPKNKIADIFEPFVQLHNNQSQVPSSGLGLTTVSQIIKSMGGSIDVKSELGVGSTFTVVIPYITVESHSGTTPQSTAKEVHKNTEEGGSLNLHDQD